MMTPRVVDISHHNKVTNLKATAAAGVWGVIHKASQGRGYRDPDYAPRRVQARAAGLLWGAYHFADGSDVSAQVEWFLKCADPDDETLLVLDFEDNAKSSMSVQQAVQFLRLLEQKTGRKGAIYSGNRLKETISKLSPSDRSYLCQHKLWLCQYGPRAVLPIGFTHYWLWQFTGDGIGPQPHTIPGIVAGNGGLDLNAYDGDQAALAASWAPGASVQDVESLLSSTHTQQAVADDESNEDTSDDNAVSSPSGVEIEVVKRRLDGFGYHDFGIMNGEWGGRTAAAIGAYKNDRHLRGETVIDAILLEDFDKAQAEGFQRPVADARANATAQDLAGRVPAVKQSLRQKLGAKVTAIGAGATGVVTGIANNFQSTSEKLEPVKAFFSSIPGWAWFLVIAGAAGFIWHLAESATQENVKDFNEGKRV